MLTLTCANCGRTFQSERRSKRFCCRDCSNKYNGDKKVYKAKEKGEKIVWSSGGGIQSTAIAVLIWQGVLRKPDFAFMADCGFESQKTYEYIERVTKPKLAEVGVDFKLVKSSDYANVSIIDPRGYCNIPAFELKPDGHVSHYGTRCNGDWKQKVLKRWLREQGVSFCIDWVGISTDEAHRGGKNTGLKWIENRYPLLELGLSRDDCRKLILDAGWEMPQRTSCIMCPQRSLFEWLRLKVECPEDFERACQIEEEIQKVNPNIWLTPKCKPLRDILIFD